MARSDQMRMTVSRSISEPNDVTNLSYLSLRDLEYVIAVADNESFSRAAKQCGVAPPSLSAQVKKLEVGLGIAIFERTTRQVMLTTEGRAFVTQARIVINEAKLLLPAVERSNLPFSGALRLAAISTLGPYLFPVVLPRLRKSYGKVNLLLEEGRTVDLVAKLKAGAVDAALLSLPLDEPSLASVHLFDEHFMLAVPKYSSTDGVSKTEDLLLLDDGHCLKGQAIAACSDNPHGGRHATSLETLKYMVAAGEGCTIVPSLAVTQNEAIDYLPLNSPSDHRSIGLCWRKSDARVGEFHQLADTLVSVVEALPTYGLRTTPPVAA